MMKLRNMMKIHYKFNPFTEITLDFNSQGSHRFLKTWKIMEFENLVSRPGIFVVVLESPEIWIFIIINLIQIYISNYYTVALLSLKI